MHFRSRSRGELSRMSGEYDDARSRGSREHRRSRSRRGSASSVGSVRSRRNRLSIGDAQQSMKFSKRPITTRSSSEGSLPNAIDSESEDEDEPRRSGVFGGLSAILGTRRSSSRHHESGEPATSPQRKLSSRSGSRRQTYSEAEASVESEEAASATDVESEYPEPYGPYGSSLNSNDESLASSDVSEDRRGRRGIFVTSFGSHGVVGGPDPLFGDSRVDLGSDDGHSVPSEDFSQPEEFDATGFRQSIYILDEDLHLVFEGWGHNVRKMFFWGIGCLCTAGILTLLGRWMPEWWLSGTSERLSFDKAGFVVAKVCSLFFVGPNISELTSELDRERQSAYSSCSEDDTPEAKAHRFRLALLISVAHQE
jgi:cation-transporting P-type ATPase 13A2